MIRTVLFAFALLCGSTWLVAQSAPSSSGDQSDHNQSTNSMHNSETTIQGCVSGTAGNYMLTDSAGTQYQLQGSNSKLSSYVNEQVEVRGTPSGTPGTGTQGTGTATTQGSVQNFAVAKVKKIAGSCSSSK